MADDQNSDGPFVDGEEDIEMWGLEDITAEELEAEFDLLQLRTPGPRQGTTQQRARPPSSLLTRGKRLIPYGKGLHRGP